MQIVEMVRIAFEELGPDGTNEQVRKFLWERFCKAIDPKYVPVYRATLQGQELLLAARANAAKIIQEEAEQGSKRKKTA